MEPPNRSGSSDPLQTVQRANALRSMGRPQAALDLLAAALGQAPENPQLHRAMSKALCHLDRYDEAIAAAKLAIAYKPDGWSMHTALALAYINAYRHADAIAPALAAVRLQPHVSFCHAWAGEALRGTGELSGALDRAQSALQIAPERHRPLMSRVLFSLGRWREAENECKRAYRQYPEDGYVAYFHGLALIAQGRHDEASALQRNVLKRQPANVLSRLLWERIESWRSSTVPTAPADVFGLEAELHTQRIALLRAEVDERERDRQNWSGVRRAMPPPARR
jgi:tetratricopeptide (TPR) repeat protein